MADDAEKKNIAKLDFNIDGAIKKLEKIDSTLEEISKRSEDYAKKISNNLNQGFNLDSIDSKTLTKKMSITEKKYSEVEKTRQKEAIKTAEKIKRNEADIAAYKEKQAIKAQNTFKKQNEERLKSEKTVSEKISQYAKTYLIYQGFNQLKQGIKETIDEMVEVQYQMVAIDRVMNVSGMDVDAFRDKLIQLAYDYGNSFDNVADISLKLAQAGIKEEANLKLTEKTLLALNTAELNATQATEDMIAIMSQWGLVTNDATQVSKDYGDIIDKINKVADNFPTTSEDILNALKKTSSAFNLAGASIDETIATIVTAEKVSQRGGKVIGTAMNNIITQLKDAGRLATVESLGIDVYTDASKTEFNSIMDILTQLSEKMQQLKQDGKENSVEMQNLLEVFTVFRRNIGAGLLSEMAGEDSTYAQVLETSINSVGYSLEENAKHMQTAKAAQEQFNATLLKLKTSVWDEGLEDVFRSMLFLGGNLSESIEFLVKTFGTVPTVLATVTLALTLFSKKMKIASYDAEKGKIEVKGFIGSITNIKNNVNEINRLQNALRGVSNTSKVGFKQMISNLSAYGAKAAAASAKTLLLKAATTSLNIAASAAATAGVMLLTTALQELINKERTATELQEKSISSTEEVVEAQQERINNLNEMIATYDELGKKQNRTPEETSKLYELQLKIKNILGEQAKTIDLINGKYTEQKEILNTVSIAEQEKLVNDKKRLKEQKESAGISYSLPSWVERNFGDKDYEDVIMTYGGTGLLEGSLSKTLKTENFDKIKELVTTWEEQLRPIQSQSLEIANTYSWVSSLLNDITNNEKEASEEAKDYYDELAKLDIMKLFPKETIENAEDFQIALSKIDTTVFDVENLDEYRQKMKDLLSEDYPEFSNQLDVTKGKIQDADSSVKASLTSLQNLSNQFATLRNAQDEYNQTGSLTISTLQGLIDNNLLQYLSIQNGQLQINAQSMLDLAEAKKVEAIEALQSAASNDIQKAAMGDVNSMSNIAKGAIAKFGNNAAAAGGKAQTAAGQIAVLAKTMQDAHDAAKGNLAIGVDTETFEKQSRAIIDTYMGIANTIANINIRTAAYSPQTTGRGSSSASSQAAREAKEAEEAAKRAAEEAKKAEEDAYKERLNKFTDYIDEKERLEKRWVDKQKELGLLSNEDYLYITQQRIERYKKYLEEVKKATWMNQEDRLELEKKYSEKIEDLQVDYIGYLKDRLDDEIDALEEANKKRIQLIEDEADARIEALKKVEDSRDRLRDEEDYQKERQEILDEISYWQQRTGREAQENLLNAKKRLEELDNEWQRKQEDWNIEDQIQKIEDERDAQIDSINKEQEAQIKAWKDAYDAKVKMFAETGQIIYEGTVMQSKALQDAYIQNFINPIKSELENLNKVETKPQTTAPQQKEQQYETYVIQWGDTLSGIASKFGTTIDKIMTANPYVTNKNRIYAGKTLQIPKFHEGGIVGGNKEAFALLKPNEVILKTEWAASLNRMMKYFDNLSMNNSSAVTGGPTIEVNGDLIKIEANVRNQNDINNIEKKVEKVLKDKFNIKK